MTGLLELLAQCRAGDVLLTGQRGGLSKMITWAGGAPVSHALLVVADGTRRVICAELVYRGLQSATVQRVVAFKPSSASVEVPTSRGGRSR